MFFVSISVFFLSHPMYVCIMWGDKWCPIILLYHPWYYLHSWPHISALLATTVTHLSQKWPKTVEKAVFWLFWTISFKKNRPNDLVRGLFLSSDIGRDIPLSCGTLCIFLGPFGGAPKWPKTVQKPLFWLFWTIFPWRMSLMIWLGLMLKLRHRAIHFAHFRAFGNLFGSIWGWPNGPKMTQNSLKNLFSGCFGPFRLK